MDVYNRIMDIHNVIMDDHDGIMDIYPRYIQHCKTSLAFIIEESRST